MSVEFERGPPGKCDSRTLSRETLSRWTGRTPDDKFEPFYATKIYTPPPINVYSV